MLLVRLTVLCSCCTCLSTLEIIHRVSVTDLVAYQLTRAYQDQVVLSVLCGLEPGVSLQHVNGEGGDKKKALLAALLGCPCLLKRACAGLFLSCCLCTHLPETRRLFIPFHSFPMSFLLSAISVSVPVWCRALVQTSRGTGGPLPFSCAPKHGCRGTGREGEEKRACERTKAGKEGRRGGGKQSSATL